MKWSIRQISDTFNSLILGEENHTVSTEVIQGYQKGQKAANSIKERYFSHSLNTCPTCGQETAWGRCSEHGQVG